MSSSYEKVRSGKLSLKGGPGLEKTIDKKNKKKKNHKERTKQLATGEEVMEPVVEVEGGGEESGKSSGKGGKTVYDIDTGTGHAPDGKKSKKYEELFPVETKRFGYVIPEEVQSREAALDERVKKKADRYCK